MLRLRTSLFSISWSLGIKLLTQFEEWPLLGALKAVCLPGQAAPDPQKLIGSSPQPSQATMESGSGTKWLHYQLAWPLKATEALHAFHLSFEKMMRKQAGFPWERWKVSDIQVGVGFREFPASGGSF